MEVKWKTLLEMYNKGVDKYIPKFKFKVKYIKDWFNNNVLRCQEMQRQSIEQMEKREKSKKMARIHHCKKYMCKNT